MMAFTLLFQTAVDNPDKFNSYLLFGYVVMWIIAMLYLGYLYNRQRNMRQDMALLKKLLQDDERNSSS